MGRYPDQEIPSFRMNFKIQFLLGITLLVSACGLNTDDPELPRTLDNIKYNEYTINDLPYEEKPYIEDYVRSKTMENFDQDSVPMYAHGNTLYYHPVYTSLFGIRFVDGYVRTGDANYLDLAERIAYKLVEISSESNEQFLFPYNFDYAYSGKEFLGAPWYYGMAQGRFLTLFSRLYNETGDETYLEWAEKTFDSLKLLKTEDPAENWVAYIDEENFYWIEEYTVESKPVHVLNGFIFAIFGIYDYYLVTNDPKAKKLLNASITTIEHYIEEYQNPSAVSFYDLRYKPKNPFYHGVHVNQLNLLSKITGELYFKEMADLFESDY